MHRPVGRTPTSATTVAQLQHLAGNRAVASLLGAPDVQRQRGGTAAPVAPAGGRSGTATAGDLTAAEAWLRYMALRGNSPRPAQAVPAVYDGVLKALQSAIGGPGPFAPDQLVMDRLAIGEGRATLKRLRADHERLAPKASADAYAQAELAIDRAEANFGTGPEAFEGGATQMDQGQILAALRSAADDELTAAREMGYRIPRDLAELPSEAQAMYDAAASGWTKRAPSTQRLTTPQDEQDLVEFMRHAAETINDMRGRRMADIARQRDAEADALREAADRQLAELREIIADRRRAAFAAGDKDTLHKIHEALGAVTGAVDDVKAAAEIITKRVDQLNEAAKYATKAGTAIAEVPKVPAAITNVTGFLEKAHSKLGTVIKLLDLAAPAKTKLDSGLKYLKAVDMTLEHFGGSHMNPFIKVYVNSYLGPGIRNCVALIGQIADIEHRQNLSQIGQGVDININWDVEQGGQAMYAFLLQVYRVGALAPLSDEAFEFLQTHRGDLEAAVVPEGVKDPMPKSQRSIPAWVARHRSAVWQSFYGSTKEPRGS